MADQPKTPSGQQPPAAELNEALSKWEALKQQGWIKPIDYIFMAIIAVIWVMTAVYYAIGFPGVYTFLATAAVTSILFQSWIVMLVYRCMDFVLVTRADINLMPVAAARMALAYFQAGQTPASAK